MDVQILLKGENLNTHLRCDAPTEDKQMKAAWCTEGPTSLECLPDFFLVLLPHLLQLLQQIFHAAEPLIASLCPVL